MYFLYVLDDWVNDYYQENNPNSSLSESIDNKVSIEKEMLDSNSSFIMMKNVQSLDRGPFICGVCKKKYKYQRDLKRHIKSECINCPKNFRCNDCDKAYYRLSHLQDHLKKCRNRLTLKWSKKRKSKQRIFIFDYNFSV